MPEYCLTLQSLKLWGAVATFSFFISFYLGWNSAELPVSDRELVLLRGNSQQAAQTRATRPSTKPMASQKIRESAGVITADYTFVNFNNDQLALNFSIPAKELAAYRLEYGYTSDERAAIDHWQQTALDDAYRTAVKTRQSQEQLNLAGERIAAEYKAKILAFYRLRGFTLLEGNILVADIPAIVQKNVKKTRSMALSLSSSAEKLGYDSDSIISAALSLVQTAVIYENVPMEIRGRQTGGVYPPLETAAVGKGDCDSKSALLASILLNWNKIRMIGVGIPGHYLLGIMRNPAKGDAFIEYKGLKYVLMEPAGPGWLPPGSVDKKTLSLLGAIDKIKIEPFTLH